MNSKLLDGFESLDIKNDKVDRGYVTINKSGHILRIPAKAYKKLPWKNDTRVDILRKGETFAITPYVVGCSNVKVDKNAGCIIRSRDACLKILANSKSCRKFECWVEEDTLFFKPAEED